MRFAFPIIAASLLIACTDQTTPPSAAGTGGAGGTTPPGGGPQAGEVEVVRDALGVAHVYGDTKEAAFYGLGWVSAQDRLYQMDFSRRYMRGRMAETFGSQNPQGLLEHDVRMRTLGFARHAERVLEHPEFPADVRSAIDAYVQGVNDFVASDGFKLPPAFADAGIDGFDPWTAVDTLLSWDRVRERFNSLDMQQEIDFMVACRASGCPIKPCSPPTDEEAAVVPETSPWPPSGKSACHDLPPTIGKPIEFKASHTWAVHGSRTTTGKPVLAMDPKLPLTAPSMWYAYAIAWPGNEARGIGLPGAPGYLVFWNRHVAQSLTAGGGDIGDLYRLELAGEGYVVDGKNHTFDTYTESIAVEAGAPVEITVRETIFGPVVTPLLKNAPPSDEFALRHAELVSPNSHSLVGVIETMQASDLESYRTAFGKILTPSANAVFATEDGHIGYSLLGAIGKRVPNVVDGVDWGGGHPYEGATLANDWQGSLTMNERPHVTDPDEGYVFSANHRPVGSWYNDYAYTGISAVGDTLRSLRLRYLFKELLPTADAKLSPADVHAMHFDAKHDAVRIFRDMMTMLSQLGTIPPSATGAPQTAAQKAAKVLVALDLWTQNGAALRRENPHTPAASLVTDQVPGHFRETHHPGLVCKYNGAEGGFSFLLKTFDANPAATIADPDVVAFVITEAAAIWDKVSHLGVEPAQWQPQAPPGFEVLYQANQYCPATGGGNCSLNEAHDFELVLSGDFGNTILSSHGSSGTGTIDFAALDASTHLVPMGASEDPGSPWFKSGLEAWLASDTGDPSSTPAAPLTRELVQTAPDTSITLWYSGS